MPFPGNDEPASQVCTALGRKDKTSLGSPQQAECMGLGRKPTTCHPGDQAGAQLCSNLRLYDPNLDTVVSADASSFGHGAVLLHQPSNAMRKLRRRHFLSSGPVKGLQSTFWESHSTCTQATNHWSHSKAPRVWITYQTGYSGYSAFACV